MTRALGQDVLGRTVPDGDAQGDALDLKPAHVTVIADELFVIRQDLIDSPRLKRTGHQGIVCPGLVKRPLARHVVNANGVLVVRYGLGRIRCEPHVREHRPKAQAEPEQNAKDRHDLAPASPQSRRGAMTKHDPAIRQRLVTKCHELYRGLLATVAQ